MHMIRRGNDLGPAQCTRKPRQARRCFRRRRARAQRPLGPDAQGPDAPGEERFVTVGADALGRIVAVVYAYREEDVRLISARPATRKEKDAYAEGI